MGSGAPGNRVRSKISLPVMAQPCRAHPYPNKSEVSTAHTGLDPNHINAQANDTVPSDITSSVLPPLHRQCRTNRTDSFSIPRNPGVAFINRRIYGETIMHASPLWLTGQPSGMQAQVGLIERTNCTSEAYLFTRRLYPPPEATTTQILRRTSSPHGTRLACSVWGCG